METICRQVWVVVVFLVGVFLWATFSYPLFFEDRVIATIHKEIKPVAIRGFDYEALARKHGGLVEDDR